VERTLTDLSQTVGRALAEHAQTAAGTLTGRLESVSGAIRSDAAEVERTLTDLSQTVGRTLAEHAQTAATTLTGRLESVSGAIRSDASEVERTLTDLAQNVGRGLADHAEKVADQLGTRLNEIAGLIDDKNGAFLTALEKTSQRAAAEISASNAQLRADVDVIAGRLGDANSTFQQAVGTAVANLGAFASSFSGQVDAFSQQVGGITRTADDTAQRFDTQLGTLRELSTSAFAEISALTQRFDEQNRLMTEATLKLDATQDKVDTTLTARRAALEDLAGTIGQRVAEVDGRLKAFHGMLETAFNDAQNRARQIAGVVTEATSGSAKTIESQFALVRSAADNERERTAAALRETYEAALADVQRLFGESGSRFAEAAAELKRAAGDVQQSIELAREEMKRGILELPAETEASAATMRRAVAEQIKALAELNEIVARQGQAFDIVEARPRTAPEPRTEVARAENARSGEPVRPSLREGGLFAERARVAEPPVADALRRPAVSRTEPGERPARPAREGGEGWLSDLLHRATDDLGEGEASRPARPAPRPAPAATVESIDTLTTDIVRMIDHNAVADAWERNRRGERGAFSRRLYTLQGQQTFDALRRKYRSDEEFRATADRYITEFDNLLEQIGEDEEGAVRRTYLTSETGKVYTMLAHASGRFD